MLSRSRASLELFLLGGFRAVVGGNPVSDAAWQRRSALSLVKLLAIEPDHSLHREQVLEVLWPEAEVSSALNSLGKALHAARHALEPRLGRRRASSYIHLENELLSLDPERVWVDVHEFETRAQGSLSGGDVLELREALAAYGGELLPEDRYEDWTAERRSELADLRIELLLALAEVLERREAYGPAVEYLRQAVQQDPAREEAHRRLMRLYALTGSRGMALRQYETSRHALQEELGVEPDKETTDLYDDVRNGRGPGGSPALEYVGGSGTSVGSPLPVSPGVQGMLLQPFVDRDDDLAQLLIELQSASEGMGRVVLVSGEPGVGKTRLLAQVAREAQLHGALVLWGASHRLEGRRPYGPFAEALESYLMARPLPERAAVDAAYPELGRLVFPHAPDGVSPVPFEGEQSRLFAAAAHFLGDLGTPHPLLLVLDDLHAADASSVQLLHYLARLAPERRWLIVGTYLEEDVEPGSDFQALLVEQARRGMYQHLDLGRLSPENCDRLALSLLTGQPARVTGDTADAAMQAGVEPAILEDVRALSLGNPLFVRELVRAIEERAVSRLPEPRSWLHDVGVPETIGNLVETRLRHMGEQVRRALTLAAVVGMEFSYAILRSASQASVPPRLEEDQLLDALDRALGARVLEERPDGYSFRHPLYRMALYDRLSAQRRVLLHRAVAQALERESPGEVEALAYHYGLCNEESKAVEYLEGAGDRARSLYAAAAAERHYGELVVRLDRLGREEDAARARQKLGSVLTTLARYDEALTHLERAADTYDAMNDLEHLGLVVATIGRVHFLRGSPEEGIARIDPLIRRLAANHLSSARVALQTVLASLYWAGGRYEDQRAAAAVAIELAGQVEPGPGTDWIRAQAEVWHGIALVALERVDEGMGALEAAVPLAEAAGDLMSLSQAENTLAVAYQERGEFDKQEPHLERALQAAERLGDPTRIAFMLYRRGWHAWMMGQWREARVDLERSLELTREASSSWVTPYALLGLGWLCFAEGDWEIASRYLEECLDIARRGGDVRPQWAAQAVIAQHDLSEGQADAARDRLEQIVDSPGMAKGDRALVLALLAEAQLQLGRTEEAQALVQRAHDLAASGQARPVMVDVLRVQVLIAICEERWEEAERALDEALRLAREMGTTYLEARILNACGLLCLASQDPEGAEERMGLALSIFQQLAARKDVALTEGQLRDLSRTIRDAGTRAFALATDEAGQVSPLDQPLSGLPRHQ